MSTRIITYRLHQLQRRRESESDVICTSGNADKIVRAAPADRNILFVPDQNLGAWVIERTGRKMDLWQGTCYVHVEFTARSINRIREQYPNAPVVAHPERTYAVRMWWIKFVPPKRWWRSAKNRLHRKSS